MHAPVTSPQKSAKFERTCSDVSGTIDNLRRRQKQLESDIKADEEGAQDYENQVERLRRRKADLEARMQENKTWSDQFDRDIGPFEQKYKALVEEIHGLYGEAKLKHAEGLNLLIKEFAYHPAFKRWNDEFTAVPFRPA